VVSSPPATEETGAIGREIESRQSSNRMLAFNTSKLATSQTVQEIVMSNARK
jgi:hypothetical protein